jgi:hypothetical protein
VLQYRERQAEVAMIDDGKMLSWEEVHQVMLPPDATWLVPTAIPDDVPFLSNRPASPPDWLTDDDPDAARADAELEQLGPGPIRLVTQVVAVNALWQAAQSLACQPSPKSEDEKIPPPPRLSPTPDDKS